MTKLPDFFATRMTVQYGEIPAYNEGNTKFKALPLHVTEHSRATVLYHQGAEVMDAAAGKRVKQHRGLSTNGTFGPLPRAVQIAMDLSGAVTWSRWEQEAAGRRAVFRLSSPCVNFSSGLEQLAREDLNYDQRVIDWRFRGAGVWTGILLAALNSPAADFELKGQIEPKQALPVHLHGATTPFSATTTANLEGRFHFVNYRRVLTC